MFPVSPSMKRRMTIIVTPTQHPPSRGRRVVGCSLSRGREVMDAL
jgi:hypothetical protein